MSEMVHIHRFECHGRNKEFVPLDEYRTLRDERDRLRSALAELVEVCDAAGKSGHHVAVGIRMKLSNAKAALTPAGGGKNE